MPRPFWLILVALLGLGACATLLPSQRPRGRITRENFDRIQEGMTEAEVQEILGGPDGYYTDRPVIVLVEGTMFRRRWVGDEGVVTIELTFDEPRRVANKAFRPLPPESFAERYRRWCRLP
jgi:hypothetical protein